MYLLRLWAYPGAPDALSVMGGRATKFPLVEMIGASLIITGVSAVRWFKDDRGHSVVERGLDHLPARRRVAVSLLALLGVTNSLLLAGDSLVMVTGFYSDPYPPGIRPHLLNGACDAPGYTGTPYGPCPGAPGYRMPVRH